MQPVAIVGLGPVGATLALLLARAGVPVVVIEREIDVFPLARAIALDDRALRVLRTALGTPVHARIPVAERAIRFRSPLGGTLLELPPRGSSREQPAVCFVHQPDLERVLREELRACPQVSWLLHHELQHLERREDAVHLDLYDRSRGERRELAVGWLLACDGAGSLVRRRLGIRMRGLTSPARWLVVDAEGAPAPTDAAFEFVCDPARPAVVAPLVEGRRRWELMLLPGEEPADLEDARTAAALVGALGGVAETRIARAAVYRFHARVAERWRVGRVLLVGDAAHLSPPFAGQGLSTGLGDAHNLAWKVAEVARGAATEDLLDSYEAERRPHVTRLIAVAVLLGLVVQTRRRKLARARDHALRTVLGVPAIRARVQAGGWKPPADYWQRSRDRGRLRRDPGGRLVPDVLVATADGVHRLDELLGPGWALLGIGTDPAAGLGLGSPSPDRQPVAVAVDVAGAARIGPRDGLRIVEDVDGALSAWARRVGGRAFVVRPDRHVLRRLVVP